jgi:hypothetical protein
VLHHRFVQIHPFDDGNGRMARVLMNLVLMRLGYLPAVIKKEDRSAYLLALSQADAGDYDPLVTFIAQNELATGRLYLRAARGESIDDLGDFDKRLALLTQSIQTSGRPSGVVRTAESQAFTLQHFVWPLFDSVAPRLATIRPTFATSDLHVSGHDSGRAFVSQVLDPTHASSEISKRSFSLGLSDVQLFFRAQGFLRSAQQDFLCSIRVYFHAEHFAVEAQLTGEHSSELFSSSYEDMAAESHASEVAKAVLSRLLVAIEKLHKRYPG